MFYQPVTELWAQMVDLLACRDCASDPDSYGEVLFMLGGNLGTLRGGYRDGNTSSMLRGTLGTGKTTLF
jgi:hypothetical protein